MTDTASGFAGVVLVPATGTNMYGVRYRQSDGQSITSTSFFNW